MDYSSTQIDCQHLLKQIHEAILKNEMEEAASLALLLAGTAVHLHKQLSDQ